MKIFDLHTHLPAPRPDAIISCSPSELPREDEFPGQLYSVGYHPWEITPSGLTEQQSHLLREVARRPDVAAIGEAGIDLAHDGCAPLFAQMLAFKTQIEISEEIGKPMILHCVKAHDIIIGLHKEYAPKQRWVVHGFRGKPSILTMLLTEGIDVSYGERFNAESVAATPPERLFAETDESASPILEIIERLAEINNDATVDLIASNINQLISPNT